MIFTAGRSVARLRATCPRSRRTLVSSTTESASVLQKLLSANNDLSYLAKSNLIIPIARRFYSDQSVPRPKTCTRGASYAGRIFLRAASVNAAKKPASKSSALRKTSKKPSAKSKSKSKAKPKKKVKAKTKAKKPKRKLTEVQKAAKSKRDRRDKIKNLKEKALLDSPDTSSVSAYKVFVMEQFKGRNKDTPPNQVIKDAAVNWKNVSPEQVEHLNHVANQRTTAKKAAWVKWVDSHTPEQIRSANSARQYLSRLQKKDNSRKAAVSLIKDERLVQRPKSAYLFFYMSRHRSGDFKGLKVSETSRLASQEWKALSAADRKPFEDAASQDGQRYQQEKKTVYRK